MGLLDLIRERREALERQRSVDRGPVTDFDRARSLGALVARARLGDADAIARAARICESFGEKLTGLVAAAMDLVPAMPSRPEYLSHVLAPAPAASETPEPVPMPAAPDRPSEPRASTPEPSTVHNHNWGWPRGRDWWRPRGDKGSGWLGG